MKIHLQILSFLMTILYFVQSLVKSFRTLNSYSEDSRNAVWTSEITLNEDDNGSDIAVDDEGTLNLSGKITKNATGTSKLEHTEDAGDSNTEFSTSKDDETSNTFRSDASWTSELMPLDENDTDVVETPSYAVEDEDSANIWMETSENSSWTSDRMSDKSDQHNDIKLPAFGVEDHANIWTETSENSSWTSDRMSDQRDQENEIKLPAFGVEEYANVYKETAENSCWTSDIISNKRNQENETRPPAFGVEGYANIRKETSENSTSTSPRMSDKSDQHNDIKLPAFDAEDYANIWAEISENLSWTSDRISDRRDQENEIKLPAFGVEEYANVYKETTENSSCTSDRMSDKRVQENEIKLPAFGVEDSASIWSDSSENSSWTSDRMSDKRDQENEIKLPAFGVEGKRNVQNKNTDRYHWSSEPMLSQQDQRIESSVSDTEEEYLKRNLNDRNKNLGGGFKETQMMPNLQAGPKSSWTSSTREEDPSTIGVGSFMCSLFEKQQFTDVTFYFEETKEFLSAHRAVLAAKCEFFEDLLFGKLAKETEGMEMHVQINEVPSSVFISIVKYLYSDDIEFSDDSTVLELYKASKRYRIKKLVYQCYAYIESIELTENDVCSMLEMCNTKQVDVLKSRCISYIEKNTSQVISSLDFQKCSYSTAHEICKLNNLNLNSEVELLEAVLNWIGVQNNSKQTKKEFTRCFLKCVRFLSFTPKEFNGVIKRHTDLLTPDEGLQILICLNNPCPDNKRMLPKWCNKNPRNSRAGHKSIQKSIFRRMYYGRRKILISLKSTNEQPETDKLTNILNMKCMKGMHQIKSMKFSFESITSEGCVFAIQINISPNGPSFLKRHLVKSRESIFCFEKPVTVYKGQFVLMEVTADNSQACKFLRFDRWYNYAACDFQCFFTSRPKTGRLYFISEVEYEPIVYK